MCFYIFDNHYVIGDLAPGFNKLPTGNRQGSRDTGKIGRKGMQIFHGTFVQLSNAAIFWRRIPGFSAFDGC